MLDRISNADWPSGRTRGHVAVQAGLGTKDTSGGPQATGKRLVAESQMLDLAAE